ncbi:MAG: bifunctional proline dehydrogenase/L-glutamate gamma-semialdehyde dehydrogenase PutA [Amphritea sp.]|nr:bifunctional proline dehydrogenase/L-glutamate gamma-semialdehyde dehydrogenase PutA [Amphritea sp.]
MFPLSLYFAGQSVRWNERQLWTNIGAYYCADEADIAEQLLALNPKETEADREQAIQWLNQARKTLSESNPLMPLIVDFRLQPADCVAILAVAELLLQIPDPAAVESLMSEYTTPSEEPGQAEEINALISHTSVWQIAIRQHFIQSDHAPETLIRQLRANTDHSAVETAIRQAMSIIREQLSSADSLEACVRQIRELPPNQTICFDPPCNNALTQSEAKQNFSTYLNTIEAIAADKATSHPPASVSIKLSALHPGVSAQASENTITELCERALHLLIIARNLDVQITIDAEQGEKLDLTLKVFSQLIHSDICQDWGGLGLTIQAYSKRAIPILGWLNFIADSLHTRIPVRLVKGAYWQSEICHAQQSGLPDYPVFTLKQNTDISYQVCASYLFSEQCRYLQPQFASHDVNTLVRVQRYAKDSEKPLELQRLHNIGDSLFETLIQQLPEASLRTCMSVGSDHKQISYLKQHRLAPDTLSQVTLQLLNPDVPSHLSISQPEQQLRQLNLQRNESIAQPATLFHAIKADTLGITLDSHIQRDALIEEIGQFQNQQWHAAPVINGEAVQSSSAREQFSPNDQSQVVGTVLNSSEEDIREAFSVARTGFIQWSRTSVKHRAEIIERFARALEDNYVELIALSMRESGITLQAAINEVRQSVNSCYYYSHQAIRQLTPINVPAIAGQQHQLSYEGHGVFACISSYRSPLAGWTLQIINALLAGNAVLSKPASCSALIATRATELLLESGLPKDVFCLLPGDSSDTSDALLNDYRLCGVAFNGSVATARSIARTLVQGQHSTALPLITTTRSLNAAIADNTLPTEEIVESIIHSVFTAPHNQRTAQGVLYVPQEIAEQVEALLIAAIRQPGSGFTHSSDNPASPITEIRKLQTACDHIEQYRAQGMVVYEQDGEAEHGDGLFLPPTLIRLQSLEQFTGEHCGRVLHLISYPGDNPDRALEELNRSDIPVALRVHSRSARLISKINRQVRVSSLSISYDSPATSVGIPPDSPAFSGTGPGAGSPDYLKRFVRETSKYIRGNQASSASTNR